MNSRTYRSAVVGLLGVFGLVSALAQSTPQMTSLPDVLPSDATPDLLALTADAQRAYFLNPSGDVWLFDRARKTRARIAGGHLWDLALSPSRDAIAYTKAGDNHAGQYVWLSPLDPKTGLAAGPERRLSSNPGDVPSFSPDGKWVAFARDDRSGVGQSIVVVPAGGGAERVVVPSMPSSVDHIRWTADGKSLYFGMNPPVACQPEWSCLPLAHDDSKSPPTIRRAAVSGGPVSVVIAAARPTLPGLSPDGTVVAHGDTAVRQRLDVTDPDGKSLGGFVLAANQTVSGWLSGAMLLVRTAGNTRRLHLTPLAGGPSQLLLDTPDRLALPAWSPDGKTIAAIRCTGTTPCELRLLNADGSARHTLALADMSATGIAWSPDQRWISYTGAPPKQTQRLVGIEVSTDRVVTLADMKQSVSSAVFWPDARRVLVTDVAGDPPNRRLAFRLVDVDGQATPLRELAIGDWPGTAVAINASTALVVRSSSHDYQLASLADESPEKAILPGADSQSSVPAFSPDRQWLAVRRTAGGEGTPMNVIDLCRVDGSARVTIDLPFSATPAPFGVVILPGAKELIVVEAFRKDVDPGVYRVTVATRAVKKLFTYPARSAGPATPEVAVSPDGQTVLYTVWDALTPSFSTMDLSVFRQPGVK